MSNRLWTEQLRQQMANLPRCDGLPRIAVVGIGQELRGDDAAGVVLARLLREWPHSDTLQIVEGGAAPANCCGLLRRWQPDLILFIDAADLGEEAGAVRWLQWQDVSASAGLSHQFSLRLLADYLVQEVGCPVALLGIQPASTAMGAPLSTAVALAVTVTAPALFALLTQTDGVANP